MNALERFFGGPPVWVIARLAVLSLIVGLVLSVLGISPAEIVRGFQRLIAQIYDLGFGAVRLAFEYFIIGAVIVFPVWLISRLMRSGKTDRHD